MTSILGQTEASRIPLWNKLSILTMINTPAAALVN